MIKLNRVLLITFIAGASAVAAPKFTAPVRYDFTNDMSSLTLRANMITNPSKENATGSLKLQLWATSSPYAGGAIRGHLIATTQKIEGLGPGQYYENLKRTVPYDPPPSAGNYYLTFALMEYSSGAYRIVSHVNMSSQKQLAPRALFQMSGPWKWQTSIEGGTVELSVAKISHTRRGKTGTLKLSLWLTDEPYRGGRLVGYEIAQARKDPLAPGYQYNNVKNVAKFVPPPSGSYYPTLVLSESDGKKFQVVAYLTSTTPASF